MQTSWRTSTTASPACTMATSRAGSSSTSPEPDFAKVQFMSPLHIRPIARRRFVQGLAIGGAVAGFAPALIARAAPVSPAELRGTESDPVIAVVPVNFTGKRRIAPAVTASALNDGVDGKRVSVHVNVSCRRNLQKKKKER